MRLDIGQAAGPLWDSLVFLQRSLLNSGVVFQCAAVQSIPFIPVLLSPVFIYFCFS